MLGKLLPKCNTLYIYITSFTILKVISYITILLSLNCNVSLFLSYFPQNILRNLTRHFKMLKCSLLLLIMHPAEGDVTSTIALKMIKSFDSTFILRCSLA